MGLPKRPRDLDYDSDEAYFAALEKWREEVKRAKARQQQKPKATPKPSPSPKAKPTGDLGADINRQLRDIMDGK